MECSPKSEMVSFYPYSEKNSVAVEEDVEQLFSEPEIILTAQELEEAQAFACGLFGGKVGEIECGAKEDLETIHKKSSTDSIQSFYLDYFFTSNGQNDLNEMGLVASDKDSLVAQLSNTELMNNSVDDDIKRKAAVNSLNWYKDRLASHLEQDPKLDKYYQDLKPLEINYKPDKLLNKLDQLQDYRQFYKQIRRQLKQMPQTKLSHSEMVLLDIYQARVNNIVVDLYPSAISLAEQLNGAMSSDQNTNWSNRLGEVMPIIKTIFLEDQEKQVKDVNDITDKLTRRLDLLKNGAGSWDGDTISPITEESIKLANEVENTSEQQVESIVPKEIIVKLDNTIWDANQVAELAESVLTEMGLLSKYKSSWQEAEKRDGFVDDGKWQIIITPKQKSFSVNSSKRILKLPEDYNSPLLVRVPAKGALSTLVHELSHVLQSEENYVLGEKLPLAKIKGRRFGTMREHGAIEQEIKLQKLFGRNRLPNLYYLSALQTKLRGGNKLESARASYLTSLNRINSKDEKELKKIRDLATDRSLRLFRNGGNNSQPLDYLEQELIARLLDDVPEDQKTAIITLCSSFNLKDAAKLHQAGLLDLPISSSEGPADIVWRVFSQNYLPSL